MVTADQHRRRLRQALQTQDRLIARKATQASPGHLWTEPAGRSFERILSGSPLANP